MTSSKKNKKMGKVNINFHNALVWKLTDEENSETSMFAKLRQIFQASLSGASIADDLFSVAAEEPTASERKMSQMISLDLLP